ncbi:MAG TPA: hypothetical protein PKN33_03765 [Phycisphaerae bacterium]|nr:hypothetical protein [Phycisphaerae bacterium]
MTMDLYKHLNLQPVQTEPDVWVCRLVVYEQISPDLKAIREVNLTKGLNIIWAKEPEDDDPPAEITGHSAGKTTFCRLLRYVLGEKTFGTKANMELIRKAFPGGYVGAELFVRRKQWAVIRPIGNGRNSYVMADATIQELIEDRSQPAYQEDYPTKLGLDTVLDGMPAGAVARTDQPIEWGHILAWCSRDQEARFQNIHDWRSARSESDWPSFRFSKADPLFVMRSVLGLFLPDELKAEDSLAKLFQDQDRLGKRLEELKREPQFRVNLYDGELRRRLRAVLPNEPDIETLPFHWDQLLPDLHRLAERAAEKMEGDIATVEDERKTLQDQIDRFGGRISQLQMRLQTIDSLFRLEDGASQELDNGLSQRQQERELLDEHGEKICILGGVLYQDCEYVQKRQETFRITQLQDAHAMDQAEAKRAETIKAVGDQKGSLNDQIEQLNKELQALQAKRDALWTGIREKRHDVRDLKRAEEQLAMWTERQSRPGEFEELDECQDELDEIAKKVERTETRLATLLEQHAENRDLLASIFSGAVRAVLTSGTYDGRVSLANRELEFRITHGHAMSGEAVDTLSVLLADVACLVYNSVSEKAHLPGILVHDSPREADLGLRIYHSFIRLIGALQDHFGSSDRCPFQYILTTTTPPPMGFQMDQVKLWLNAAILDDLLLRRNVAESLDPPNEERLI